MAMILRVSLRCFLSRGLSVMPMSIRDMSVVRGLFVISGFVMFGRLLMVLGGLPGVFRCFLMVFGSLLRHEISSEFTAYRPTSSPSRM
jgi:hypothetical protein